MSRKPWLYPSLTLLLLSAVTYGLFRLFVSPAPAPAIVSLPPLEQQDLNPERHHYQRCQSDADCLDGRECFASACRRPVESTRPYGPCEFNRACPPGHACLQARCKPLRRSRASRVEADEGSGWPQYRGPHRDAVSGETGLLRRWPQAGPHLLWQAQALGRGYGHPAISKGRIYTTGLIGNEGHLTALDLDGRVLWQVSYGPEWRRGGPAGARQTPTVAGDILLVTSGFGLLSAHHRNSGAPLWQRPLYGAVEPTPMPNGYADAPLVIGDRVYLLVGSRDRLAVAVDLHSGAVLWQSPGGPLRNAYGTFAEARQGDQTILVGLVQQGMVALNADNGDQLWLDPIPELAFDYVVSGNDRTFACPPIVRGNEIARTLSDYERGWVVGSRKIRLAPAGSPPTVVWRQPAFGVHYGGALLMDERLFGVASNDQTVSVSDAPPNPEITLMAVDWATGNVAQRLDFTRLGKAGLIGANGLLFAHSEDGVVALVETRGATMELTGTFRLNNVPGSVLTYPALADRVLYIRNQETLLAYDVAQSGL